MKKVIIIILTGFFLLSLQVEAQESSNRLSSAEEIAIAFYKTAGIIPDFRPWIWERSPFKYTPLARRGDVFEREELRLQSAYQAFNIKRDLLRFRAPVDVNPQQVGDIYRMGLTIRGLEQTHYISVNFMDQNFAIFPFDFDLLMNSVISEQLYERFIRLKNRRGTPFILISLRPYEADISRPFEIDDLQQWVFKTKIVTMALYSAQGDLLWEYNAPIDLPASR